MKTENFKVKQFTNFKNKPVNNHFTVFSSEFTMFVSYGSNIVKTTFEGGQRVVYLDERFYNYSKTTSKYRNMFLGEDSKTIESKIKSGIYKLTNLN